MIRLNLATDYALRTLLLLATRQGQTVSTADVAAYYQISADHVGKVAAQLAHAGYLHAGRGRRGGLRLATPPERIRVGEIVELFEGRVALLECVDTEDACVIQPTCRLRHLLSNVGKQLVAELNRVTLADLIVRDEPLLVQLDSSAR
jgi:Rrf2 family nitric oxide-sensitive transcriptional repressor